VKGVAILQPPFILYYSCFSVAIVYLGVVRLAGVSAGTGSEEVVTLRVFTGFSVSLLASLLAIALSTSKPSFSLIALRFE